MIYEILPRDMVEVTPPVAEPVSREEMKAHLRADYDDEDALIDDLVTSAREYVEKVTNLSLAERTYRCDLPCFVECAQFSRLPVTAVVAVKYWSTDSPSTLETLADTTVSPIVTSQRYRLDANRGIFYRAYGQSWPTTAQRHDAVQITVTAGHAPAGSPLDYGANVPQPLRAAIKLLAAELYEFRETHVAGTIVSEMPTAKRLMSIYREY